MAKVNIVGKGPSLDYIEALHLTTISINEAADKVAQICTGKHYSYRLDSNVKEPSDPNTVLVLGPRVRIKTKIPLVRHTAIGAIAYYSSIHAIHFAKDLGADHIYFWGFDSILGDSSYAKSIGRKNNLSYAHHYTLIVDTCRKLDLRWTFIFPKAFAKMDPSLFSPTAVSTTN
jgi:hypothetical protein